MRITAPMTLLLAAALLGCDDTAASAPADGLATLRVEGRVLDDGGAPVPGAIAVLDVWYSSPLKDPVFDQPYAVAGPDGTYILEPGELLGTPIDSIGLTAIPPGCLPPTRLTVVPREQLPGGPDGELALDIISGTPRPAATTAVGQVCASGNEPEWGATSHQVVMRIDSLRGEIVYGRWGVFYRRTEGGADGSFEGRQHDGLLALVLKPEGVSVGLNGCTELRLVIPVDGGGAWGRADVLQDNGCLPTPDALTFAPESVIWIFP